MVHDVPSRLNRNHPSIKRPSTTMHDVTSRPKRRCLKPSIIEPPITECVKEALRVVKMDKTKPRGNSTKAKKVVERNVLGGDGGERIEKSFDGKYGHHALTYDDPLARMAVEPPKLNDSFSALIMTDEITAVLPSDSQKSINENLHSRIQRLENLVAMLMQQKNDEMELLLK